MMWMSNNGRMTARMLLAELQRRRVLRAAALYAAAGWLLVQVATQVFPFFNVPNWAVRAVVMAALIGFPFAVLFAWFFEWTPQGLRRESEFAAEEPVAQRTRRFDRWIVAALSLAVVALLANELSVHDGGTRIDGKSIAVLPLVNESGDLKDDYFSDGLSEELISTLGQIPDLKVIGRNSSFQFKNKSEDVQRIGAKLGVATLLEGTVRKQAGRVRVVAELVNVTDGRELWSHTYDRDLKDLFTVQSDIAQSVANALKVALLGPRPSQPSEPVDAHNAYLRGQFFFERYNWEGYHQAVSAFDEAIRIDPDYALAYAKRAIAWSRISDGEAGGAADTARAAARADAAKAVALAPDSADAHAALGWVSYMIDWNFDKALAELRRADQLAPGSARNKDVLSHVLLRVGKVEEAKALGERAVELDPLAFETRNDLARTLTVEGRLDEADAQGRIAAELQPTAAGSHRWQVIAAVLRANGDGALREAALEPNCSYRLFETALAQDALYNRSAADAALNELIAGASATSGYQIAEVYAMRGDSESAFKWLDSARAHRDSGILGMLIDPLLRGLRADPRFPAMLHALGLPTTFAST